MGDRTLNAAETTTEGPPTRIDYRRWIWRIVTWDGVIAVLVMLVPLAIQIALQKQGKEAESLALMSAIFIPIAASFIRWAIGSGHLATNHCGLIFRQVQTVCFFVGLLLILVGEAIALCIHGLEKGKDAALMAIVAMSPFYAGYLLCMIIAMYPGREPIPAEELTRVGNWKFTEN